MMNETPDTLSYAERHELERLLDRLQANESERAWIERMAHRVGFATARDMAQGWIDAKEGRGR